MESSRLITDNVKLEHLIRQYPLGFSSVDFLYFPFVLCGVTLRLCNILFLIKLSISHFLPE